MDKKRSLGGFFVHLPLVYPAWIAPLGQRQLLMHVSSCPLSQPSTPAGDADVRGQVG